MHNISKATPKKSSSWKGLPLCDILARIFESKPSRSIVFNSIWNAWEVMRGHISNNGITGMDGEIYGERLIWWNLKHNDKPLSLLQGFSAKIWASRGINNFFGIIHIGQLLRWCDIIEKFHIPPSHHKTYSMLRDACSPFDLSKPCQSDSFRFLSFQWPDGSSLPNVKAKSVYDVLVNDLSILSHVKSCWKLNQDHNFCKRFLSTCGTGPLSPKRSPFVGCC